MGAINSSIKRNYLLLGSDLVEILFHAHQLRSLEAHHCLCFTSYEIRENPNDIPSSGVGW